MKSVLPEHYGSRRLSTKSFESLVASLSTKFASLRYEEIDEEISKALKEIVEFMDTDRCAMGEKVGNVLTMRHIYARPGIPQHADMDLRVVPWFSSKLLAGESVILSDTEDLPEGASAERDYCSQFGLKSIVSIPLFVGGSLFGVISTASFHQKRRWPEQHIKRLRLLGEIFANALTRKQSEQKIHAQLKQLENQNQFERLISDISVQFVNVPFEQLDARIEQALEQLVDVLQIDRLALLQVSTDKQAATVTHSANATGVPSAPVNINYVEHFPWHAEKILRLEILSINTKDLPSEASIDRISAESMGIRSNLVLPLVVNDSVEYVLAVNSVQNEREWGEEIVSRIRLLGEIFANTLTLKRTRDERRHAQIEAQRLYKELTHLSRISATGEIAASIAHELNQPLTGILSNSQAALRLLSRNGNPDLEEIKEVLADIVDDNKRASEIIRKVRRMVKKTEQEFWLLDLNPLIEEVIGLVRSDAIIRNVNIEQELAAGLPQILGDRIQLQQVLLNLLLNSLDALSESESKNRRIIVRTFREPRETITVAVRDYGKGIFEKEIDHLFEPFFTTKREGMGMGLSIASTIINAHRGSIRAENNPDLGATFYFTLPACVRDEASS